MGWTDAEFKDINLGDKRLNSRIVKLCDTLSEAPESPINQACADWAETKAAYRFFHNESVNIEQIIDAHRGKTVERAAEQKAILIIQDTSYLVYTSHLKAKGLGTISLKKGKNIDKIYSQGLVMHTSLALTTSGTPLGLIDQNIFPRQLRPENQRRSMGGKYIQDFLPVEEKESFRWIKSLQSTMKTPVGRKTVTICDRECDFYDFFKAAEEENASVLIRASQNRTINRNSRYAEKNVSKLWDFMESQATASSYTVEITAREKNRHCKGRKARKATMSVKFASFRMNPPRNNPKHGTEKLPDIKLYAIHVLEQNPPKDEEPIEWI